MNIKIIDWFNMMKIYISLDNNNDKVLTYLLIELINSFDLRGNKSHSEQLKILNN